MAGMLIVDPLTVPVLNSMSPKRMVAGTIRTSWGAVNLSSVCVETQRNVLSHGLRLIEEYDASRSLSFESDPLVWSIRTAATMERES